MTPTVPFVMSPCADSTGESFKETSPYSSGESRPEPTCSPDDRPVKDECPSPCSQQESPSQSDSNKYLDIEEGHICARLQAIEQALFETVDSPYSQAQVSKFAPSSAVGMFNMADTFIRRFIKFCKCLPEFADLVQTDQIALLKVGANFYFESTRFLDFMGINSARKVGSHFWDGFFPLSIIRRLSRVLLRHHSSR